MGRLVWGGWHGEVGMGRLVWGDWHGKVGMGDACVQAHASKRMCVYQMPTLHGGHDIQEKHPTLSTYTKYIHQVHAPIPTSVKNSPSGTSTFHCLYLMRSSGSPMACKTCARGLASRPLPPMPLFTCQGMCVGCDSTVHVQYTHCCLMCCCIHPTSAYLYKEGPLSK